MKKIYFLFNYVIVIAISLTVLTSSAHAQLYINEFMAKGDAAFPGPQDDYPDWIEIYNAGSEAVMLGGYYMYDILDPAVAYQIPDTYPDSVTVAAGGFIMFYANKDTAWSVLNLNFKLGKGGEQIGLWDTEQTMLDEITFGEQTADISYGRYPDGTDYWGFMSNITPGASNTLPDPPELFINEFMASNDVAFPGPQGDYPDWIEIYNPGDQDIMLGGYYMADDLADPEAMYQIPSTYPDSVTVAAGGYILFYANKGQESSVLNLNFKLGKSGEQVGLWSPEEVVIDSITYYQQFPDTSYGRYTDGSDDWYLMTDYTPGASNTNPNPPEAVELYINEFMASNDFSFPGPQGDYPDWIEIYNAGTEDVMLGGYFMSDDLVDPEAMFEISNAYPDSVTVKAGGYILFYANKGQETSVLNLNFKLGSGGEQVGLWDSGKNVLDSLTYGAQITDTSFGRYPDGGSVWGFMADITPGATNSAPLSVIEVKDDASISQNFPNPFSSITTIEFTLENAGQVTINVYDIRGAIVTVLANDAYPQGKHAVSWNASNIPAGYYFYTLQTGTSIVTKKALVIH